MPSPCRWLETPWLLSGGRRDAMVGVWSLESGVWGRNAASKKTTPILQSSPPFEMWPKRPVNSRSSLISMGVCPIRRTSRGNCGPPRRSTRATNRGRQLDDEEGTWHVAGAGTGADWQGRAVTSPVEGQANFVPPSPTTTPSRRHSQRNHQPPPHLAVHPSRKAPDDNARLTRQQPRPFLIVARPPRHAIHPLYFIAFPKFL